MEIQTRLPSNSDTEGLCLRFSHHRAPDANASASVPTRHSGRQTNPTAWNRRVEQPTLGSVTDVSSIREMMSMMQSSRSVQVAKSTVVARPGQAVRAQRVQVPNAAVQLQIYRLSSRFVLTLSTPSPHLHDSP